jgi:hypothetical protein
MLKGLRRLADGTLLLVRIHRVLTRIAVAQERVAAAMEARNQHDFPAAVAEAAQPGVEVSYVDDAFQAELLDIEMRLTRATGQPPTDDEIMRDYEIRHPGSAEVAGNA